MVFLCMVLSGDEGDFILNDEKNEPGLKRGKTCANRVSRGLKATNKSRGAKLGRYLLQDRRIVGGRKLECV